MLKRTLTGFSLLFSVCWLALGCGEVETACEMVDDAVHEVIGGKPAAEAEIFSTVAVWIGNNSHCSGSLIAPQVVVTAAHCVVMQDEATGAIVGDWPAHKVGVIAGQLDISKTDPSSSKAFFAVRSIHRNTSYPGKSACDLGTGLGRLNDLALLILDTPILNELVTPAYIPTPEEIGDYLQPGTMLTVEGYGIIDVDSKESGILYLADIPYDHGHDQCLESEFIAGIPGGNDTCYGDSGGPVYLWMNGKQYLIGATSRGTLNNDPCSGPGIYTFLPEYASWLIENSEGLYVPTRSPDEAPSSKSKLPCTDSEDGGCSASPSSTTRSGISFLIAVLLVALAAHRRTAKR